MELLDKWVSALTKPGKTFKKEAKKKHTISQGAMHILVAGIVSSILWAFILNSLMGPLLPFSGIAFGVFMLVLGVLGALVNWIIFSGVMYVFAMIFSGKGSFTQQSYLLALYTAPLGIVTAIVGFALLAGVAGAIIFFILYVVIVIYSLYLLTLALRTVHRYSTGHAILTWLIPAIILVAIVGFLFLLGMGIAAMAVGAV